MPVKTKPVDSRALYEAAVNMNRKEEKRLERAKKAQLNESRRALRETAAYLEASFRNDRAREKYGRFSEDVKVRLLGEVITELCNSAMQKVNKNLQKEFFTRSSEVIAGNITYTFIRENGEASSLMYNMGKHSNLYVSDMLKLIKSTHRAMLEDVNPMEPESFKVGDYALGDFKRKACEAFAHDDIVDSIADRVTASIKDFIQQNAEDKEKIIQAMQATKEKIDLSKDKGEPEQVAESYAQLGRRYVSDIRERKHSLFDEMVRVMCKTVVRSDNQTIREAYLTPDSHIDMEKVVRGIATMYTFVETVNTMQLVKVDQKFVDELLESITH